MTDPSWPFSAAAERNQAPILAVLAEALPASASVLEIASGTGQHAAHFTQAQAHWQWQPTDADLSALAAIAVRCAALPRVRPPVRLDVLANWPDDLGSFDAVYCANLLHISPWATCTALMHGAAARLVPGGLLAIYGPFIVDGQPTAPGNLAFDADLRRRDPAWGLRRLADVVAKASGAGFVLERVVAMPANNLTLLLRH